MYSYNERNCEVVGNVEFLSLMST